jgi:hypothetical protein
MTAPAILGLGHLDAVTEDELREIMARYWVIDAIKPARIHAVFPEGIENMFPMPDLRDEPNGRLSARPPAYRAPGLSIGLARRPGSGPLTTMQAAIRQHWGAGGGSSALRTTRTP